MVKILFVLFIVCLSNFAQSSEIKVLAYSSNIGKIAWEIPDAVEYHLAVPHFTSGPRIRRIKSNIEEFEINVYDKDENKTTDDRKEKLLKELEPSVPSSVEGIINIKMHCDDSSLYFSTFTDKGGEGYKYFTMGFRTLGNASIWFHHLSNDHDGTLRSKLFKILCSAKIVN